MSKVEPIDEEYLFQGRAIVSETDTRGVITYANRKFCEISGYTLKELVGQPHSIIRHPDMPREAFIKMWDTIKSGQIWTGLVKNLRKDGLYYWVETEIVPSLDENGNVTGYVAARRPASKKNVEEISKVYAAMRRTENKDN